MYKAAVAILIFLAGWSLGWLMHHYMGHEPLQATPVPAIELSRSGEPAEHPAAVVPVAPDHGAELALLLQRHDFESVMARYEFLQQTGDAALADAREQILAYARQLISDRQIGLAETLLQQFLVAAWRDVDARILLAEAYRGQGDYPAAIDQLYEARGYAGSPDMLQRLTLQIRSLVKELAQSLQRHDDQVALLALYRQLAQLEPDHAPWFIGLAAAQLALDDTEGARRSLLLVAQDPDVGAQAQMMLAELRVSFTGQQGAGVPDSGSAMAGMPLRRSGNHFIVEATSSGGRSMQLLIDTGASMTILTPELLARSGIRYRDTGRTGLFNTANGPVEAPVLQLDSLAVGDWQVSRIEVGVLDLAGMSEVDGLLGMNFLNHFQFFIDQNEGVLRLAAFTH